MWLQCCCGVLPLRISIVTVEELSLLTHIWGYNVGQELSHPLCCRFLHCSIWATEWFPVLYCPGCGFCTAALWHLTCSLSDAGIKLHCSILAIVPL